MVFANPQLVERYVKFRPTPPPTLINAVVEHVREGRRKAGGVAELCVDLGCGSGQSMGPLAPHFPSVVGVDVSQPQLDMAAQELKHLSNVSFRVGSAEGLPFGANSVDLVTCCAAAHWFNFETFYKEVDRVLRPGGVLACYSYITCSPLCNGRDLCSVIVELYHELDRYWTEGHQHLWKEYASLPPLYPIDTHIGSQDGAFSVVMEGTMEGVLGYVSSWSATDKLRKNEGEEAAADYLGRAKKRLFEAAGIVTEESEGAVSRRYDYFLRMWQKPHP